MGPDGFDSSEFAGIGGDAAVGTYYTSVAAPVTFYPAAADFAAAYVAEFGEEPQPFAAQAYDSTGIVIKALELAVARSGGTLPAETAKARALVASIIRATDGYEGLTGTYTFDAVGDAQEAKYYIIRVSSADAAAWGGNELLSEQSIASPLYNAEKMMMGGM
jgi:ABC-type branched-subunit amino acid transport system substrate-binding protein